ncbi:cRISPR-associated endoribonuclease Cas2 [Staphylococcus sp. CAG:324]|nr:cRISPR-associated endoribonuclease Cas2 [Staphylococcus sp. CAG:324]
MRTILFFDLPTLTLIDQRNYRKFVKGIKKLGFYMLQESIYVKMSIDSQLAESVINKVKLLSPSKGSIMVLTITEKQFSQIQFILGENVSNIISSDERIVVL